jgi:pseudouridine-5'-monophosphatase
VSSLLERNIPLAIATSSTRENLSWKLPQHVFLAPIRVVVPGDDPELHAAKPAPDIFLLAASRLGVRPEDAVVFEDSPAGVQAARAAGMQVVARVEPELDPEHFRGATLQVRSLAEISAADLGFG